MAAVAQDIIQPIHAHRARRLDGGLGGEDVRQGSTDTGVYFFGFQDPIFRMRQRLREPGLLSPKPQPPNLQRGARVFVFLIRLPANPTPYNPDFATLPLKRLRVTIAPGFRA